MALTDLSFPLHLRRSDDGTTPAASLRSRRDAAVRWLGLHPVRTAVYLEIVALLATATLLLGAPGLFVTAIASIVRLLRFRDNGILTPLARGLRTAAGDICAVYFACTVLIEEIEGTIGPRWGIVLAAAVAAHAGCNAGLQLLRRRGLLRETMLIVGPLEAATDIATSVARHRELGLVPIISRPESEHLHAESIAATARRTSADRVVLLASTLPRGFALDTARGWRGPATLHLLDDEVAAVGSSSGGIDDLWGHTLVAVHGIPQTQPGWMIKRAIDVVGATLALVLAAPIMAAVAWAVRATSPGPVLFRQQRVGLDGEPFTILKFRSMPVDHRAGDRWNAAATAEPTTVGRFIRATSLDELPQLLNVLRGDMSLVGPRPELPSFVAEFQDSIHGYRWRHRVPAGITGWAQAHGLRGDTSLEERVRFDNHYIDRWSLGLELRAMALTIRQLLPDAGVPQPDPVGDGGTADPVIDLIGPEGGGSSDPALRPARAS